MSARRGVSLNSDGLKILESHIANLGLKLDSDGKVNHKKLESHFAGTGCGDWQAIRKIRLGKNGDHNALKIFCERLHFHNWDEYLQKEDESATEPNSDRFLPPNYPHNNLPSRTSATFAGRDEQLAELDTLLKQENPAPVVVTGMPGVGKSELALQYAWQHLEQYTGGVVWIDAREDDIATRLVQFAICFLDLHPPDGLDPVFQLGYCCQRWSDSPQSVLLILDDLDEYRHFSSIQSVLPKYFRVLITTRQYLGSSVRHIILGVLSSNAALALLASVMDVNQPIKRTQREKSVALDLCYILSNLPLAVELIGRFLDLDTELTITSLYETLRNGALANSVLVETHPQMRVRRGVMAAFDLSWERLPEDAKRLGCFVALFSTAEVAWSLVESASVARITSLIPVETRSYLIRLNLLRKIGSGKYQMHRLLQEFFQVKLDQLGCGESLKQALIAVLTINARQIPERPNRDQIKVFQDVVSHIREAVPKLLPYASDNDIQPLFTGVRRFYQGQGAYAQALDWSKQCLAIAQDRLGSVDVCTITLHCSIGCLHYYRGEVQEAEQFFKDALVLSQQSKQADSPETAVIMGSLAALYRDIQHFEDAEQMAHQALKLREANLAPGHPDIAEGLMTLGTVYFNKGRFADVLEMKHQLLREAKSYFWRVLKLRKQLPDKDHPDIGESWNNLGVLCEELGYLHRAEKFHEQAIAFNKRVHDEVHPITASSYNNLGKLYLKQKRYAKALKYFKDAEKVFEDLNIPPCGWCRHNMALVYEDQGELQKAAETATEAYWILKEKYKLPDTHPFVEGCRKTLERLNRAI
jgi:tetratricopeptide (TPR) repeat protein